MARIRWSGDFENAPISGEVVGRQNGLLTILWDDGRQQIIPEFVTKGAAWSAE